MKIVADDRIPFLKGVFEPFAQVVYLPGKEICKDDLKDADVLITRSVTRCDSNLLDGTSVSLIATATIGDDHIDRKFCREKGIGVVTAPGCNASAVEQYICAALLTIAEKKSFNLKGMKLGIVGVGNVGSRVMKIAETLGMKTLLNDPPRADNEGGSQFVELNTLLEESDIITLHVLLTYEGKYATYHLADESFFTKIKKPVVFINSSRGKVVETNALKDAVKKGRITASVIDVWEGEPEIDRELLDVTDIATPHIAGYSIEGKARATQMVVEAVSKHFAFDLQFRIPEIEGGKQIIEIDCDGKSVQTAVFEAVSSSYNIMDDDKLLRKETENFEGLRRNYKFRREFGSFGLRLENCGEEVKDVLSGIGFDVG